jgi:peptidoglycan/LPS O-acetylase OafA/YrhL
MPVFAALIFGLAGPHPISSVFSWKPILLIGESTYCLYLLHFNVFMLIHMYNLPERLHLQWADPWISYAVLLLLAIAVYKWFENPARQAILNRWGSHRQPRSSAPAA